MQNSHAFLSVKVSVNFIASSFHQYILLFILVVSQVPLDLIEWQPVYHQIGATGLSGGQWSANWRVRSVLDCRWVIVELKTCDDAQENSVRVCCSAQFGFSLSYIGTAAWVHTEDVCCNVGLPVTTKSCIKAMMCQCLR